MFESTSIPDGWIDLINKREGLLTPSKWCADWFKACGVKVPVYILHHGIDPLEFPFIDRMKRDREYLTFCWQGVNPRDRKGYSLVDEAFKKLRLPKTRLILKAVPVKSPRLYFQLNGIKEIWDWYTQSQMIQLFGEADVSLNPTSGEGFGLIPLEHAATGLYTMATAFSGCLEYLDDLKPNMAGLKWKPKPSYFNSLGGDYGYDAAPDFNHLCDFMRWCSDNRDKVYENGKKASSAIHKRWTWQRPIEQLKEILKSYAS